MVCPWFKKRYREFIELNEYSSLKQVFRIAIKVELYLLKTTSTKRVSTTNSSTPKSTTKTSNIKCFKCLGFGHIALHCPQKTLMINKEKQDLTHPPTSRKNEKDQEGQDDMGLILSPPRCFPSLSFSLPKVPISAPSWLKNVRDDFIPPHGFHH